MSRTRTDTVTAPLAWEASSALGVAFKKPRGTYQDPSGLGFGIRVNKDHAVWTYRFRAGGDVLSDTLGKVGITTTADALSFEDAAKQFLKLYKRAKRSAGEGAMTLADGLEQYKAGRVVRRTERGLSADSLRDFESLMRHHVKEAGDWVLQATDSLQWEQLLTRVKTQGSIHAARRAYWMIHGVYAHLMEYQVLDENPLAVQNMRLAFTGKATKRKRTTHLPAMDVHAFWQALESVKFATSKEAVKLLFFTSWRRSGVLGMKWSQVDFQRGVYHVKPDDKGWKGFFGEMVLNDYALRVLRERKERLAAERPRSGTLGETQKKRQQNAEVWVFPAYRDGDGHMRDVRGTFDTISKELGAHLQAHDVRRGWATIAEVALDNDLRLIGRLMCHQQVEDDDERRGSKTTDGYIIKNLAGDRWASNEVAGVLEAMTMGPGMLEVSFPELVQKFKRKGISLERPLPLAQVADDDETAP
jgi:integrase